MARRLPIPNGRLDGALDANGMRIVNAGRPTSPNDVATKKYVDDHAGGGGGGGTSDYNDLENKPKINGHTLDGDSTLDQIGAQKKLKAGANVAIGEDGTISASGGSVVESEKDPGYAANANYSDTAGFADMAERSRSSGMADAVPWGGVTDTPTTVDGYGISDAAKASDVDSAAGLAMAALSSSAYPLVYVSEALSDRSINHATSGGSFTFPVRQDASARDFVLVIDALPSAPSVTFVGDVSFVSDQSASDVWTAEAGKTNAWYFSEIAEDVFMVSHKAFATVSQ